MSIWGHSRAKAPTEMSQRLFLCDEEGPDPLREGTANITQIIGKLKGAGKLLPCVRKVQCRRIQAGHMQWPSEV